MLGFIDFSGKSLPYILDFLWAIGTGLPKRPESGAYNPKAVEKWAVANVNVYWGGQESLSIAREWFAEQFGITFAEETRPMTVYVVKEKDR